VSITRRGPQSTAGIALVTLSVVIMPFLSWAQRRAGRELGSASAVADSKQTLLCTYLSAAMLIGLVLNAALGWWWADPIVALGLAAVAVREGRDALRGETCCPALHLDENQNAQHSVQHGVQCSKPGGHGDDDTCGCGGGLHRR
jgi:hypothetical protein